MAALTLGPIQFDRPAWLLLIPILGLVCWWLARRSLGGLGTGARWAALGARLLAVALLAGALAQPHLRRVSESVGVTFVVDVSRSIPSGVQEQIDRWVVDAQDGSRLDNDLMGVVTAAESSFVQSSPSRMVRQIERQFLGGRDASNLEDGLRLALAARPADAAWRIVLVSDGNETDGSLARAAQRAGAMGVPVEVVAVDAGFGHDVMVEDVKMPSGVRVGETVSLRVVITTTSAAEGRLSILENGRPIDLSPDEPDQTSSLIRLSAGRHVLSVPVTPRGPGAHRYEAVFEAVASLDDQGNRAGPGRSADAVAENNRSAAVTFVASEGVVLLVSASAAEAAPLADALASASIEAVRVSPSELPATLEDMAGYDAIVMINQSAYESSLHQQELLRRYVHDTGGGLVKVGGPDAFGAGGWIGSPLADALPIRLDPPQKRQMPMGALALVIDASGSMSGSLSATGASQQQMANEAAIAALQTLSRRDQGVVVAFAGSPSLIVPLTTLSDMSSIARQIRSIRSGGGTNMFPAMEMAGRELLKSDASVKHMLIVTDGQTVGSDSEGVRLANMLRAGGITISTISVGDSANDLLLSEIAVYGGGRWYQVRSQDSMNVLPQIFMKEAQTVRRALIWEGEAFSPAMTGIPTESMRGISQVPPVQGYVVAAEREGLSLVTLRGKENDPISAQWQHGLGRVVTFTADAGTKWAPAWVAWPGFRQFWEQHVRWAMRPNENAVMRVTTENRGDRTVVVVDAMDSEGERLDFVRFDARIANPDGSGEILELRQTGPGRYEGAFDSGGSGSYVISARYRAAGADGAVLEGSLRAAVTRSYADEFRFLGSNRPLLRQVAAFSGGRMLDSDPAAAALWSRDGMVMPVALRPLSMLFLLLGIAAFLVDVAARRVRIEPRAAAIWTRRALRLERHVSTDATDALRSVRGRTVQQSPPIGQAARRYEAPEHRAAAEALSVPLPDDAARSSPETSPRGQTPASPTGDALSALRAARMRAKDQIDEQ